MDTSNQLDSQQSGENTDVSNIKIGTGGGLLTSVNSRKERAPIDLTENIRPSEPALDIHPEIARLGVEKTEERPVLTDEHRRAGLKYSEPNLTIVDDTQTTVLPTAPISESQARKIARSGNINDKKFWFSNLILKVLKRMKRSDKTA